MVVYLDVLFCLNVLGTLFQLLAAQLICRRETAVWRTVLTALLGGAAAAGTFFLPESAALGIGVQAAGTVLLCAAAFAPCPKRVFVKAAAVFAAVGTLYTGAGLAVWYLLAPEAVTVRNGVVYFEISPWLLIGSTAGCYLVLTVIVRLTARQPAQAPCELEITYNRRTVRLRGIVDTGCALTEPISGDRVIVLSAEAAAPLLTEQALAFFLDPLRHAEAAPPDARLIPADTVAGKALLAGFRPQRVSCRPGQSGGTRRLRNVYIAVSRERLSEEYDALIGSRVLE